MQCEITQCESVFYFALLAFTAAESGQILPYAQLPLSVRKVL